MMEITWSQVPQPQLMAPPLRSKQQDLATEACLYPTGRYHVHPSIGGPGRREVCQLQVAIPDLVVVPQLVMPTLALLGEKEDGTWGAFLWEGWRLVGCTRHWVEEAWQLRVFHVARVWHTPHTYEDPCAHCPVGLMAFLLTRFMVEILIIGEEQGMSSDEVLQDPISVGTAQATTEEFSLAVQRLLGQCGHVSHREHLSLRRVASLHGHPHQSF